MPGGHAARGTLSEMGGGGGCAGDWGGSGFLCSALWVTACLVGGWRPGCAPGGAVTFFCFAKRKSPKKRRPCCLRPLRCAAGQPGVLGHGVHRRTRCAPAALRSNNCGESVHEACALRRACHPAPCAPQAHTEGNPPGSDIHSGHRCARPRLRSAWRLRPRDGAERSKGPCGCSAVGCSAAHPLLAAPAAGRLWGEHGRRSAHASCSDSPQLSERSAAGAQ